MTVEVIATGRLLLRSTRESDFESLYRIVFSAPEVMAQAFDGAPYTRDKARRFYARAFDHDGNGRQLGVLTRKTDGAVIGFAGLLACRALGRPDFEIGFVLGRDYWGHGYATEIGHAQVEYGLVRQACPRLLALVAPANLASRAVLRKIGMREHATIDRENRGERLVYLVEAGG